MANEIRMLKLRPVAPKPDRAPSASSEEQPVVAEITSGDNASVESQTAPVGDDHLGDVADAVLSSGIGGDAVEDGSQSRRQQGKGGDYEVGYGKPPKEHQFPKGRSPNAAGRPKDSLSLKTELKLVIGQPVAVTENGKRSKRSTLAVLLMKLRVDALAGKPKAVDQLIRLILTQLPDEVANDYRQTAAEDAALLARFKARET